jgi:hypothetical protein
MLMGRGAGLTLFALLTYVALRRYARHPTLLDVLAAGALVSLVASAAQQKEFRYHFYPSFALALALLGVVVWDSGGSPRTWVRSVYRVVTMSVLATALVAVLGQNAISAMRLRKDAEQIHLERMVPVVRPLAAGHTIYVMSYHIGSVYPLINYSGARSASRFAHLWLLPALYMDQLVGAAPIRYRSPEEMSPSERFLNQGVFEDLRDERPRVLIVLQHARDLPVNGFRRLDYVQYFRRDPRIASLLDRYQLAADLGDYLIYERIPDEQAKADSPPAVQPATHDIVPVGAGGGPFNRVPVFLLALLTFVASVILGSRAEKGRA